MERPDPIFSVYLRLGQLRLFDKQRRSLFASYKIFGTKEEQLTQVFEDVTQQVDLLHRFIFPVGK